MTLALRVHNSEVTKESVDGLSEAGGWLGEGGGWVVLGLVKEWACVEVVGESKEQG